MKPDVLMHFADRIAQIGVYEGLWWRQPIGYVEPDGMRVRLDDGTPAVIIGECIDDLSDEQYLDWTDGETRVINAVHDHSNDTLRWRDERGYHVESCALART